MSPWDLIVWALAGGVALVVIGVGIAVAVVAIRSASKS